MVQDSQPLVNDGLLRQAEERVYKTVEELECLTHFYEIVSLFEKCRLY
jgi:hypothetical protein